MGQIQKRDKSEDLDVSYIFCKQIFAPWENLDDDPVGIDLIYEQIINGKRKKNDQNVFNLLFFSGIRTNVYKFEEEFDPIEFALLAVQHYFIEHGKDIDEEVLREVIQKLMPPPTPSGKSKTLKPFLNDKDFEQVFQIALQKDEEVNRKKIFFFLFF